MGNLRHIWRNYKSKAEKLRTIAQTECCPERSKALLKIADDYERMAQTANPIEDSYRRLILN